MLIIISLTWLVAVPLVALAVLARRRGATAPAPVPAWRDTWASLLYFALAFNIVFFVQELFLVLPKAFVPGLNPTLFHNNHTWRGSDPIAALFQGTGALATLLLGLGCALALRRPARSTGLQLLLAWLAYCGAFMALPQFVIGAVVPQNDVGMAFTWFGLAPTAKVLLAILALLAMPTVAAVLAPAFLALAPAGAHPRTRFRAAWRLAALPALLALPLVFAFRVPREWLEVVLLPLIVVACGIPWLLVASAARPARNDASTGRHPAALAGPALAVLSLLAVFQLLLRPGIPFY